MLLTDIGASFKSASLLIYPFTINDEEPTDSTSKDSISFGFSTETATGVLAYIRSDDDEQQNMDKSIVIKLTDGNVEASLDFGNGPSKYTKSFFKQIISHQNTGSVATMQSLNFIQFTR